MKADRLGLVTESPQFEQPLLQPMFKQGERVFLPESLAQIRERTAISVGSLPDETRQLDSPVSPLVGVSDALLELTQKTRRPA
jgi:nicotinate phosphoribosyltransferase